MANDLTATFVPDQGNYVTGATGPNYTDAYGNLATRGPVTTDEGSFRTDFTTESVTGFGTTTSAAFGTTLSGTSTFVNGSTNVVGTGTSYQQQVRQNQWIKLSADPEADYVQVFEVNSETSITLQTPYAGTSATGATVVSNWKTSTPTGGWAYGGAAATTIALVSGTTAATGGYIVGQSDSMPFAIEFYVSASQANANTAIYMGLQDVPGFSPNQFARFVLGALAGGSTTTVSCNVGSSTNAGDNSSVLVQIPNGGTFVNSYHLYKIDIDSVQVSFSIDGILVATQQIHLPQPYTNLFQVFGVYNGATASSSTTATIDMAFFENIDRLQIGSDFTAQPIAVTLGTLAAPQIVALSGPGSVDTFGTPVAAFRGSQIQIPFYSAPPSQLLTVTTTGSGTTAQGTGVGTFSTGTTAGSEAKGVTPTTLQYAGHDELWAAFTASFTTGVTTSYQRIGPYNATDGFSFGYNNATFGIWTRYNGVDTFVAQTAWNQDTLQGGQQSKFTSSSLPVALVPTDINLYRIRYGWLGIASVYFEVYAPDGNWVTVHIARFTNAQTTVSMTNPNVPITVDVSNTTGGTNLVVTCGCWVGGLTGGAAISTVANGFQAQDIVNAENLRPTYFIALQGFATGAVNTDCFCLIGSATKVVRVTRIRFSMTATTAVEVNLQLIKRSTANAGGSLGVAVNGSMDSNDAAATATNLAYTANATTLGTPVGTAVRSDRYAAEVGTTPATQQPQIVEWIFGEPNCKPPILRGVAQSVCVNLGGATIAGGEVNISIEWTEDNT